VKEHVAINMVDNEILTLVCRIGHNKVPQVKDLSGMVIESALGTALTQVSLRSQSTDNTSGIQLNKGKLEGPNIRKFAFEHQYQPNEDRPVCCKLYKCTVKAWMPMK
jgi:hypothetical protein